MQRQLLWNGITNGDKSLSSETLTASKRADFYSEGVPPTKKRPSNYETVESFRDVRAVWNVSLAAAARSIDCSPGLYCSRGSRVSARLIDQLTFPTPESSSSQDPRVKRTRRTVRFIMAKYPLENNIDARTPRLLYFVNEHREYFFPPLTSSYRISKA